MMNLTMCKQCLIPAANKRRWKRPCIAEVAYNSKDEVMHKLDGEEAVEVLKIDKQCQEQIQNELVAWRDGQGKKKE